MKRSTNPSRLERGHSCPPVGRAAFWSVQAFESRGGQECPRSDARHEHEAQT
jgi:hypothetical protein